MSGFLSNKTKRFLKKRLKFWFYCLTHPILNEHLIVFEAFSGKRCGGNLRAIYEELMEDERYRDFRFVWIVNDVEAHLPLFCMPRQSTGLTMWRCLTTSFRDPIRYMWRHGMERL